MNSSYNATEPTRRAFVLGLRDAARLVESDVLGLCDDHCDHGAHTGGAHMDDADHASHASKDKEVLDLDNKQKGMWRKLFVPLDFFSRFEHFVDVELGAASMAAARRWKGYALPQLRRFVSGIDATRGINAQPWPCAIPQPSQDDVGEDGSAGVTEHFFIGLSVQFSSAGMTSRLGAKPFDLTGAMHDFAAVLNAWPDREVGMELSVTHRRRAELPPYVRVSQQAPGNLKAAETKRTGRKRKFSEQQE